MTRNRTLGLFALAFLLVAGLFSAGSMAAAHDGEDHGATPGASPGAMDMGMGGHADTGTGAAYLSITNNGDETDTLLSASSDVAKEIQVHDMKVEDEVMSMIHLEDGLEIPAGETVVLEPMSYHVMLIGLNESLMPGASFDITLTFEHAGDVTVTAVIDTELPDDGETYAAGDLEIEGVWSRPAPMLTGGTGDATPDATPQS